jgi:hypothetical protein
MSEQMQLHAMLREIREDGYSNVPAYRPVREAATDGRIPATLERGRWYAKREDKAAIVKALGLVKAKTARAAA